MACRAQSNLVFLESCWQRRLHKRLTFNLPSVEKDRSALMSSTFLTRPLTMQQSHSHSGQSIWRTAGGGPLTWMRIGTPLWKAGPYPSLFAFRTERDLRLARLSSAQTQSARIAKPSRRGGVTCFTGRSRKTATREGFGSYYFYENQFRELRGDRYIIARDRSIQSLCNGDVP